VTWWRSRYTSAIDEETAQQPSSFRRDSTHSSDSSSDNTHTSFVPTEPAETLEAAIPDEVGEETVQEIVILQPETEAVGQWISPGPDLHPPTIDTVDPCNGEETLDYRHRRPVIKRSPQGERVLPEGLVMFEPEYAQDVRHRKEFKPANTTMASSINMNGTGRGVALSHESEFLNWSAANYLKFVWGP